MAAPLDRASLPKYFPTDPHHNISHPESQTASETEKPGRKRGQICYITPQGNLPFENVKLQALIKTPPGQDFTRSQNNLVMAVICLSTKRQGTSIEHAIDCARDRRAW